MPGVKHHRQLCETAPSLDLILDSIEASELEREVVHLVRRVDGIRSAVRVVHGFRPGSGKRINLGER